MRFGLSDLFLLTFLVACYATGFSYLATELGASWLFESVVLAFPVFVGAFGAAAALHARGQRKLGGAHTLLRTRHNWNLHGSCLAVFATAIACAMLTKSNVVATAPWTVVALHFGMVGVSAVVGLGETGVLAGSRFYPWDRVTLSMDERSETLTVECRGSIRSALPSIRTEVVVPDHQLEQVVAILNERRDESADA